MVVLASCLLLVPGRSAVQTCSVLLIAYLTSVGSEVMDVMCACYFSVPAGRVLIAQGGVDGQKIGLAVALRYACSRPQFGEKRVIEYLTHQSRLLPALANTYALQLAQRTLKVGAASCLFCCCICWPGYPQSCPQLYFLYCIIALYH
jgi:hypothetical protein